MAKSSLIRLGITAAVVATPSTAALALVAPTHNITSQAVTKLLIQGEKVIRPETIEVSGQKFANRFDASTKIEIDARSRAVRLITGDLAPAPGHPSTLRASELVDVATNWIASHEDYFKFNLRMWQYSTTQL